MSRHASRHGYRQASDAQACSLPWGIDRSAACPAYPGERRHRCAAAISAIHYPGTPFALAGQEAPKLCSFASGHRAQYKSEQIGANPRQCLISVLTLTRWIHPCGHRKTVYERQGGACDAFAMRGLFTQPSLLLSCAAHGNSKAVPAFQASASLRSNPRRSRYSCRAVGPLQHYCHQFGVVVGPQT